MTRIASSMFNASALADLQRAQRDLYDAQRKTASQKEADDLKGYGQNARNLVSLQRMRAHSDAYTESASELTTRLEIQDSQLGRSAEVVGALREKLTEALALGDLSSVAADLANTFNDIKSSFNATLGGKYLFGGTASDQAPITATNISDLANNPLADAVNSDGKTVEVRIAENRQVNAAPLASSAAQDILTVLRDLQIFEEGVDGPFTDNPTEAQKTAIQSAILDLKQAHEGLLNVQASNGQVLNQTDEMIKRHTNESNLLESLAADITDVDLAEVAVKLNQAQLQYQATASVFSTIQGLSLVDYLR
ncbi:MAG: hypothetical protein CMK07_03840 [Ponticaulis sp.]|nr:hypothetical protein [Ponticaulis sp.]